MASVTGSLELLIQIPSFKQKSGVTFFDVDITKKDLKRVVHRRFSDFEQLSKWIRKFYPDRKDLPEPPSSLWIADVFSTQEHLNESRRQQLEAYLQALQRLPDVFASFPVQHFLRLYDMRGKVVIVTGANTGIGRIAAEQIAEMGAHVIMACRSEEKTRPVVEEIIRETGNTSVEFMKLDLGRLASVREFAMNFLTRNLPLHVLLNNAGLASPPTPLSDDGFEVHMGVNHLGMVLLTDLLKDKLIESAPSRCVVVSSRASLDVKWEDIDWTAQKEGATSIGKSLRAYGKSKLCNCLFATEMAHRHRSNNVSFFSFHPGVVGTDVWRSVPSGLRWMIVKAMISPEEGARTSVMLSCHPGLEAQTGLYFDQCLVAKGNPALDNPEIRRQCIVECDKLINSVQ